MGHDTQVLITITHLIGLCSLPFGTQAMLLLYSTIWCHLFLQILLLMVGGGTSLLLYTKIAVIVGYNLHALPPCTTHPLPTVADFSAGGATLELRLMFVVVASITSVYALASSFDALVGDVLGALVALRLAGMTTGAPQQQ